MRRFKRKLKNTVIETTFLMSLGAYVVSIGSIGEPGFTWDRLPHVIAVAGVSFVYIILFMYANRETF